VAYARRLGILLGGYIVEGVGDRRRARTSSTRRMRFSISGFEAVFINVVMVSFSEGATWLIDRGRLGDRCENASLIGGLTRCFGCGAGRESSTPVSQTVLIAS